MEDAERAVQRKRNINAVQPILRALRTNSLGKWTAAAGQREQAHRFSRQMAGLLAGVLPQLRFEPSSDTPPIKPSPKNVLVIIGTERGLCGRFNATLADYYGQHTGQLGAAAGSIELVVLGTRLIRLMRLRRFMAQQEVAFPPASLPPLALSVELARHWLQRYEQYDLDTVDVIYNAYRGSGAYLPRIERVIPPALPELSAGAGDIWPPYQIETAPSDLYAHMVEQLTAINFHDLVLQSSVTEHAARSQLMDAATQNAQRALDELSQAIQLARQHAITSEMQELSVGAGLLKRQG